MEGAAVLVVGNEAAGETDETQNSDQNASTKLGDQQ